MPGSTSAEELDPQRALIEDFGFRIGGAMGWPPMAGRAAGVLMLSEESVSMAQLQQALGASKGSVSEVTRLLIDNGVVERFKKSGQRQYVYQWRPDAWIGCLRHQVQATTQLLDFARDAREKGGSLSPVQQRRLDDMAQYYVFIVERLEQLLTEYIEGWDTQHETLEHLDPTGR